MIGSKTIDRRSRPLPWLLALYGLTSFAHFAHNAEYLDVYPNLPAWLSRFQIYGAWGGIMMVGLVGYTLYRRGRPVVGLCFLVLYTSLGFDGLLHYQRAPLAAHSVAMNLTIWSEVAAAALALVAVGAVLGGYVRGSRERLAAVMLTIAVASTVSGAQRSGGSGGPSVLPRSSGLLTYGRDGHLRMASAARISHEAGWFDKLGSFVVGLGYQAPAFNSAALCLLRLTPRGLLDPGFGNNGSIITPLLPLQNHDSVTVTALLEDASGRPIVVGWRTLSTALDANVPVIVAARYTSAGALDPSFGERGIVTTRIEKDYATQAFAAALDGDGRLLVAGYNGGRKSSRPGAFDDWPVRVILLRYTASGVLDTSFGAGGVASHILVPSGPSGQAGREFLLYDYGKTKTAALILDRQGRPVVAAAGADGPVVLMRYTREGALDSSFGSAGTVQTPIGKRSGISALLWDVEGRLLAAGTSDDSGVLLRYSADGALDATFGDGGMRRTPIGEGIRVSAAAQEGDGHVLMVASGKNSVQLARYDRNGKPDQSFGPNGVISTAVDKTVATAAGLAIDDKGTPVVTAVSANGIFVMRYNRSGPVDKSFHAVPNAHP